MIISDPRTVRSPITLATGEVVPAVIAVAAPYGTPGPQIAGTSNSVVTVSSFGTKSFTIIEYNRSFSAGVRLRATSRSDGAWLEGVAAGFNSALRLLDITADLSFGSGARSDWNINVAGEKGQKGDTGATGLTGPSGGPPGPPGPEGPSAGHRYTFSNAISGDPGAGKFLLNNANLALATTMSISEVDGAGVGIAAMLAVADDSTSARKGIVRFASAGGSKGIVGFITGTMTDLGVYDTYPWTPVMSWGPPVNNDLMYLTWSPVGDKGDIGNTGVQGVPGPTGPQGILADAPSDSQYYSRRNAAWQITPGGLTDAASDGSLYGRLNAAWAKAVKLAGDTMTGDLKISKASPVHTLNKTASGQVAAVIGALNDLARWSVQLGDGVAEAGSNSGSEFELVYYNDAGAAIAYALRGSRATGLLSVAGNPTAPLGIASKQYVDAVIPAGAPMLFFSPAAPTGWTKSTLHNDKAIRIVSGTGGGSAGTYGFSAIFPPGNARSTVGYTLALSESPFHGHAPAAGTGNLAYEAGGEGVGIVPGSLYQCGFTGLIGAGGGGSHGHLFNMDLQYVDAIICTKN